MVKKINGVLFESENDVAEKNLQEVFSDVWSYFEENLPQYTPIKIRNKSYHPDDAHLYMVAAIRKDGASFAVWTGWNERLKTLNFGHYDLADLDECDMVMNEFYNGKDECAGTEKLKD